MTVLVLDFVMPLWLTVVVDVLAWGLFHSLTGYAAHRIPPHRLRRDGWLLRERAFEDRGRWYRRRLRIQRWKDRVPEAGDFFQGGTSKSALPALDDAGLQLFVRETRRAELGHWWAMWCGPLFLLWNPPAIGAVLVGYGVLVNLPFIAIQRFNRARTRSVLERRAARRGRP